MDTAVVLRSKTVHISSAILAAKSPYFYKVISRTSIMIYFSPGFYGRLSTTCVLHQRILLVACLDCVTLASYASSFLIIDFFSSV